MKSFKMVSPTFLLFFILLSPLSFSQIPRLINFQGAVLDNSGNPISDGNHTFVFRLYNASTAGTSLWFESGVILSTNDGLFTYELGTSTPFAPNLFVNKDSSLYLEVSVDGQIQSPRTRLVSVPFAESAGNLNCQSPYTAGPIYRTYPFAGQFSIFGEDGLEQTRLWGDSWGELLLHNGRASNGLTAILSASEDNGGQLILADSSENPVILLDAGQTGDGSVVLPVSSVSPFETFAEAGVANHIGTNFFTSLTVKNYDYIIDSVIISIPADGYVELTAGCYVNTDHVDGFNTDIFVGISKTQNVDYYVPGCVVIGIAGVRPTGNERIPAYSTRLFSEQAGTYTYYLVAERSSGGTELTNIANPSIVARYFPTAYGSVTTTSFDNSSTLPSFPNATIDGTKPFENPFLKIEILTEENHRITHELAVAKAELAKIRARESLGAPQSDKERVGQKY